MESENFNDGYITGARIKVVRAGKHLNELERKVRAFVQRHPETYTSQLDPNDFNYRIYEIAPNRPPPVTLGPVLGDVVHNLRATLDHIAWNLALRNLAGSSSEPYEMTAFPLIRKWTNDEVDRFWRLAVDILPAAIPDIGDLQPAHARQPNDHPLALLDRMWNADKHRFHIKIPSRQSIPVASAPGIKVETLKSGSRRVRVPARRQVQFEQALHTEILFEIPTTGERISIKGVRLIHDFVRDEVVPRFSRFLPESIGLIERRQGIARL